LRGPAVISAGISGNAFYLTAVLIYCWRISRVLAGSAPGSARHLPGGDVEPVEEVGRGNGEDEGGQPFLVVMPGGLVPDLVRDRIGSVAEPGDGFGQGERGA
jgi:hypothetical protein